MNISHISKKLSTMTSSNKPDIEQYDKKVPLLPLSPTSHNSFLVNLVLRILLFASTLTAISVLITSNQTILGPFPVPVVAKFNYSLPFIYLLVALSVTGLYSIITTFASISVILKPEYSTKLLLNFALWDLVILGLVGSATGMAGGGAYAKFKGNFCSIFDKFCRHVGGSLIISLFLSVLLVFLIWLNENALHKRHPK